ncbi:MAG: M23 family metallopeptidase [Gemmatimonadetes bacterium]|nr:M23 family metallopeptidase [Gemmatimonadota bacterium]
MPSHSSIRIRLLAAAFLVVAWSGCSLGSTPDAGELDPVYARPAETVRILTLAPDQTLGEILQGSVSTSQQYDLLLAFQEQASPRRMRAGTEITLRYLTDNDSLRGVDVALNSDRTVRLTRDDDGWHSETVVTPTYTDTVFAAGVIRGSLWTSVVDNPALGQLPVQDRVGLLNDLDNVFQWQVDFSRQIQEGDTYRFAFERQVRPDGSTRSGHLLAAELVNAGTPYDAIWFDPNGDGQGSYYDLDGKSVRRAFLMKPLQFTRISSRFSLHRWQPILHIYRPHEGVDYAAKMGTPIMATADGVVIFRGRDDGFGNCVKIRHPNGWVTLYGHMEGFKRGLHVGSRVHQSDIIGYVGMTGLATGPHLHYQMIHHGVSVDPLSVKLPKGDPVPTNDMAAWRVARAARLSLLQSIPAAGPVRAAATADAPDQVAAQGGG